MLARNLRTKHYVCPLECAASASVSPSHSPRTRRGRDWCDTVTAPGPNRRGPLVRQCLNGHSHNSGTCTVCGCDGVLIATASQRHRKACMVCWCNSVLLSQSHSAGTKQAWSVGVTASYCHRTTAPGPNRRGLLVRQCLNGHSHNARTCTVSWCDGVLLSPSHSARRKHAWSIGVTTSYYQRVTALEESMHGL